MELHLTFLSISLLPYVPRRPSDKQDEKQQQTIKPVHWTPPNPWGHHIASNFSSRTTRISPRPLSFTVLFSIIPAPALSFSFPSYTFSLPLLLPAFIILYFHARSLGLHDGWSLFRGPPPCSIVAHHGCSWPGACCCTTTKEKDRERWHTRDCLEAAGGEGLRCGLWGEVEYGFMRRLRCGLLDGTIWSRAWQGEWNLLIVLLYTYFP